VWADRGQTQDFAPCTLAQKHGAQFHVVLSIPRIVDPGGDDRHTQRGGTCGEIRHIRE
jgi:hypothetical protein